MKNKNYCILVGVRIRLHKSVIVGCVLDFSKICNNCRRTNKQRHGED